MNKEIEPSEPRLNPDPDVLDVGWWVGLCFETTPKIKRLAESGCVRDVREALRLVRLAEEEIAADLEKGRNSYFMRVRLEAPEQVLETFKLARHAAMKLKSDPEWRLLDAVEGKEGEL